MLKKLFAYFFKKTNKDLVDYVKVLEKQLREAEAKYTTLKVPSGENLQTYLSELYKNEYFLFYLHTIENELIVAFTNGKESDLYRGGLKAISRVREGIKDAYRFEEIKRANKENV